MKAHEFLRESIIPEADVPTDIVTKSAVKAALKEIGHKTIKAFTGNGTSKSLGKTGIALYSMSPMDVTNAGLSRAEQTVQKIRRALGELGAVVTSSGQGVRAYDKYTFNTGTRKQFTIVGLVSTFPTYLRSANLDPGYQTYWYMFSDAVNESFEGEPSLDVEPTPQIDDLESDAGDPVISAVIKVVRDLIGQGHIDVDPNVITNHVVSATGKPFLLKDLVAVNNKSPEIQHYIDSINPTKVKFSTEILTVKNEDPAKEKEKSQATVSSMAARALNKNRAL